MARKKKPDVAAQPAVGELDYIAEDLRPLAVPLSELRFDKRNARAHNEKNLAAIKASLARYGMRKPIVLNVETGEIEAGNGTLQAAILLGWSHVAVVRVRDDPATHIGFGLADNRTAELAEWDEQQLLDLALEVKSANLDAYDELLLHDLVNSLTNDAPIEKLDVKPLPPMTWALVGVPTVKFGRVADTLQKLGAMADVQIEISSSNYEGQAGEGSPD